jgi:hypothetical protein
MSEIFGVAGVGLTYDIMRYTVGYQAVRGINVFNPFNFPLGRKGQLLAQELPIFTDNQVFYNYLSQFNSYVERLSYISSLGERVCETGLYYPVCDFQGGLNAEAMGNDFDALGRVLEDMMVDFDIVDDDVIQSAEMSDGFMHIGRAKYKNIIIPHDAYIPAATEKALNVFIECGGRVTHEPTSLTPVITSEGGGLRAMHRKTENAEVFCLFREAGESGEYNVYMPSSNGYILDLNNGELQHLEMENDVLKISLAIGEVVVIVLTKEQFAASNKKQFKTKFEINNDFMFSKEIELVCGENGFFNVEHCNNSASVKLGDWSCLVGSAYSGSGVYETTFTLSDERVGKEGEIHLGDVHFVAKVYLNNQLLGVSLMPPYSLKIPEGVLDINNTLKVVVANTPANWYAHTDYFDKWKKEELSPYFDWEMTFAKDYVSGGLYGPVVIYME